MDRDGSDILAVAFDLDGLMFNTEELYNHVGGELLQRRGKQFTLDLLNEMMGRPGQVALQIMIDWHQLDDSVDHLQRESDEIFGAILDEQLRPLPGLIELLAGLEQHGIPKAVTTSSRRSFVDRTLGIAGLAGRFDFILSAEDVTEGKPAPEIYLLAARHFAVESRQMMVLEDSENGCRAGVAAGAVTVAVPGEPSRHHDFSGVHFVAESLADRGIYARLQIDCSNGGSYNSMSP